MQERLTMSNNLVGDVPSDELGAWIDIFQKRRSGVITADHIKRFAKMDQTPFAITAKNVKREIEKFAVKTRRRLSTIFKKRIIVDPLPLEFTDENLAYWATLNLRPVVVPREDIGDNRPLKNWTKLSQFFYDNVRNGKIKPIHPDLPPTMLRGCWHLADFTISADYTDGSQVFMNDPLAPIIAKLREQRLVGNYGNTPMGSRFAITPDEWQDCVLAYIASKLGVTLAQIRLERAIEFNAIGNLYDPNRGKFNAWEWFEDAFEGSYRLCGGYRGRGGLANVDGGWRDYRYSSIAARPLVSFIR